LFRSKFKVQSGAQGAKAPFGIPQELVRVHHYVLGPQGLQLGHGIELLAQGHIAQLHVCDHLGKRSDDFAMEIVASKPEAFEQFIAGEIRKWARVIAEAKIQPE
jgi:tripartite-type tricarboxylate transporter receptor subunit TctC